MKKNILALVLAAVMLFTLSACGVPSSSTSTTSFSTSITDADGNTTTTTVTNEMGVSAGTDGIQTTNETTTSETTTPAASMADFFPPKEDWFDVYAAGGEGQNEEGDAFYFAYNDPENLTEAMLLIRFSDGDVLVRNGEVIWNEEDECLELQDADVDTDNVIPFVFLETEEEDGFAIRFLANGMEVFFEIVDQETIINDIYDILASSVPGAPEEAEDFAEEDAA